MSEISVITEQQQDEEMERLKKERELRKKKEEMDSLTTLEENKEQVSRFHYIHYMWIHFIFDTSYQPTSEGVWHVQIFQKKFNEFAHHVLASCGYRDI